MAEVQAPTPSITDAVTGKVANLKAQFEGLKTKSAEDAKNHLAKIQTETAQVKNQIGNLFGFKKPDAAAAAPAGGSRRRKSKRSRKTTKRSRKSNKRSKYKRTMKKRGRKTNKKSKKRVRFSYKE